PTPATPYARLAERSAAPGSSALRSVPETKTDARTGTACRTPSLRAAFSEQMIAAAAPSPIGEHIISVSGGEISREASTSSRVQRLRYCALGLSAPCSWL